MHRLYLCNTLLHVHTIYLTAPWIDYPHTKSLSKQLTPSSIACSFISRFIFYSILGTVSIILSAVLKKQVLSPKVAAWSKSVQLSFNVWTIDELHLPEKGRPTCYSYKLTHCICYTKLNCMLADCKQQWTKESSWCFIALPCPLVWWFQQCDHRLNFMGWGLDKMYLSVGS